MPIDVERVMGTVVGPVSTSWNEDKVILYHLGVGAGRAATDPKELEYVYEGGLKVLPSFAVIPVCELGAMVTSVPGMDFNPALALHGEQEIEVFGAIPPAAETTSVGQVVGVYDKRKAALVVFETKTSDVKGKLLFVNRFSIYLRGEGGVGAAHGPAEPARPPERSPDLVVESPTLTSQALLYRLSGDKNPLHADPAFAKLAGFDRPILHGLCTYGIALKAIVDRCLDGAVDKVAKYQVRFRGVVYPGETLVTSIWREPGRFVLVAQTKERGEQVLSNALITLRD